LARALVFFQELVSMGAMSIWHWLIVLAVVLVLFGRGRVADIMGEFGKGIKSFKSGMDEEVNGQPKPPAAQIPAQPAPVAAPAEAAPAQPVATPTEHPGGQA